jgi:hypothetical protein
MSRLTNAWRALAREQRLAALCSLGLFVSMLLPWYSKTDTFVVRGAASSTQQSLSAFQAFSFVEAAVLLVSAGILALLFARAEQRDFHLPGGDGTIVMIAGGWAALLIFYRLLDKPGLSGNDRITATVGVEWGIFIALLLALGLSYTGARIRTAERLRAPQARARRREREARREGEGRGEGEFDEQQTVPRAPRAAEHRPRRTDSSEDLTAVTPAAGRPEQPAPDPVRSPGSAAASRDQSSARRRPRFPPAPSEQMSFEDPPPATRSE